jgi:hypothetical protein
MSLRLERTRKSGVGSRSERRDGRSLEQLHGTPFRQLDAPSRVGGDWRVGGEGCRP